MFFSYRHYNTEKPKLMDKEVVGVVPHLVDGGLPILHVLILQLLLWTVNWRRHAK